jgi:hypothetical protein
MKKSKYDFCLGYMKDSLNVLKLLKKVSRISVYDTWRTG